MLRKLTVQECGRLNGKVGRLLKPLGLFRRSESGHEAVFNWLLGRGIYRAVANRRGVKAEKLKEGRTNSGPTRRKQVEVCFTVWLHTRQEPSGLLSLLDVAQQREDEYAECEENRERLEDIHNTASPFREELSAACKRRLTIILYG